MKQPTPGAIRAAEIITGGTVGSGKRYTTQHGEKKIEGIAAIIDEQTAAPDLLAACKWVLQEIEWGHDMTASAAILEQRIAKAETTV